MVGVQTRGAYIAPIPVEGAAISSQRPGLDALEPSVSLAMSELAGQLEAAE